MMSWWKCKHGAPFDTKWRTIARRVNGKPGDVWAVASALFDAASQAEPRGSIRQVDLEEIADGFGYDLDYVTRIHAELQEKDVHDGQLVLNFEKHQTAEDTTAAERKRRQRQKEREGRDSHDQSQNVTAGHVSSRVTERDINVTERDQGVTVTEGHALSQQVTVIDEELEQKREEQTRPESESARAQNDFDADQKKAEPWPVGMAVPDQWKRDAERQIVDLRIPVVDVELEAAKFATYYGSRGAEQRDNWHPGWINWILRADPMTPARQAQLTAAKPKETQDYPERSMWDGLASAMIDECGIAQFRQWLKPLEIELGDPLIVWCEKEYQRSHVWNNFNAKFHRVFKVFDVQVKVKEPKPKINPGDVEIPASLRRPQVVAA